MRNEYDSAKAGAKPKTLADLFEGYTDDYASTEWDISESQGKEML